jgi:hypothetical protein
MQLELMEFLLSAVQFMARCPFCKEEKYGAVVAVAIPTLTLPLIAASPTK